MKCGTLHIKGHNWTPLLAMKLELLPNAYFLGYGWWTETWTATCNTHAHMQKRNLQKTPFFLRGEFSC